MKEYRFFKLKRWWTMRELVLGMKYLRAFKTSSAKDINDEGFKEWLSQEISLWKSNFEIQLGKDNQNRLFEVDTSDVKVIRSRKEKWIVSLKCITRELVI